MPPRRNASFLENTQLALLTGLRWRQHFKGKGVLDTNNQESETRNKHFCPPFQKNTVKLPPNMTNEQELNLFLFKEVLKKVQQEVQVTKRYKTYKEFNHNFRVSKKFLDQHDATVVATDKSKRLC